MERRGLLLGLGLGERTEHQGREAGEPQLQEQKQGVGGSPNPPGASNPSKGTQWLRCDSHREDGSGTFWMSLVKKEALAK